MKLWGSKNLTQILPIMALKLILFQNNWHKYFFVEKEVFIKLFVFGTVSVRPDLWLWLKVSDQNGKFKLNNLNSKKVAFQRYYVKVFASLRIFADDILISTFCESPK